MSTAKNASRCDHDKIPTRIKVEDSDGGETVYVRINTKAPMPTESMAALVWDEAYKMRIELGWKEDGATVLGQTEIGLPEKCVLSLNFLSGSGAFGGINAGWGNPAYVHCVKE